MTKNDLIEKLKKEDEWTILELLDINSEDLVDAFLDKITERLELVYKHYEW